MNIQYSYIGLRSQNKSQTFSLLPFVLRVIFVFICSTFVIFYIYSKVHDLQAESSPRILKDTNDSLSVSTDLFESTSVKYVELSQDLAEVQRSTSSESCRNGRLFVRYARQCRCSEPVADPGPVSVEKCSLLNAEKGNDHFSFRINTEGRCRIPTSGNSRLQCKSNATMSGIHEDWQCYHIIECPQTQVELRAQENVRLKALLIKEAAKLNILRKKLMSNSSKMCHNGMKFIRYARRCRCSGLVEDPGAVSIEKCADLNAARGNDYFSFRINTEGRCRIPTSGNSRLQCKSNATMSGIHEDWQCYHIVECPQNTMDCPQGFTRQNMIMVKPGKVGGSTLSGVVRGIGAHHHLYGYESSGWIQKEPGVFAEHGVVNAEFTQLLDSLEQKKFLLTIIRDPAERCLSDFYYFQNHGKISLQNRDFTDKAHYFYKYCSNYQFTYLFDVASPTTREMINQVSGDIAKDKVDEMLEKYDFVGLTERFNETMVLLKHILGLKWHEVLYLPVKVAGLNNANSEHPIEAYKSYYEEDRSLKDFVLLKWNNFTVNKDFYLHQLVEEKFDSMIASIPTFEDDLQKYELALEVAQRICGWVVYEKGQSLEGYLKDNGKGHECIDKVGSGIERFFLLS